MDVARVGRDGRGGQRGERRVLQIHAYGHAVTGFLLVATRIDERQQRGGRGARGPCHGRRDPGADDHPRDERRRDHQRCCSADRCPRAPARQPGEPRAAQTRPADPADPDAREQHHETHRLVRAGRVGNEGVQAVLVLPRRQPITARTIAPSATTTATMATVFAESAASCAEEIDASVRADAASTFVFNSAFGGASTGGNIAGAGSSTSLKVSGPDVIEYLICVPSTVPAMLNVYFPGCVGMNEAM